MHCNIVYGIERSARLNIELQNTQKMQQKQTHKQTNTVLTNIILNKNGRDTIHPVTQTNTTWIGKISLRHTLTELINRLLSN